VNQAQEELVRLPYELLPWQVDVKRDRHRFRTIAAGRRSGKTWLLCDLLIEAALTYAKGLPCWYVAPTYGMAKDIAWSLLKDITADLYRARMVTRYYETELRIDFWNGSSIHLKGADNQDSLRGRGLGFLGVDEIEMMGKELWQLVLRPAVSDYQSPVIFIGTPKGYNYFWELSQEEKRQPDKWRHWSIKTADAGTLSAEEIAQARRDMDEQSFRQEYEASFELFAGQIYHWDEQALPTDIAFDDVWYGGDFGYSVDPSAIVRIYRRADEFWLEEVLYKTGLTNQALASMMKGQGINGDRPIYFDSAEPKSIDELRLEGLLVRPAEKGPDSVRAGIDFIRSKKVHVVKGSSENLMREMRSYCWRQDKVGNDMPEPAKGLDHLLDAVRYGIFTHCKRGDVRVWSF
jgi:phage terminase large subunit